MKKFGCVIVLLALAGCLNFKEARVTPEHRQLLNKAAVVVFLDADPILQHLQLSVKETTATTAHVEGWNARQLTEDFLLKRMKGMGLSVKSVPYTTKDFPSPYDSRWTYPNPPRMRQALAHWGAVHDVNMVVAVYRQVDQDFIGHSIENLNGYGIVKHEEERIDAYTDVYMEVINSDDGGVIGNVDSKETVALDPSLWRATYDVDKTPVAITGAEAQAVVGKLTEVLTKALQTAAQEVGLSR
ncbi:MAG: hypothetical protein HYX63_23425 [Gammaproteobacteria bacterium]|nr:hypothetical protein [Gammaproteobacteria bacterium]